MQELRLLLRLLLTALAANTAAASVRNIRLGLIWDNYEAEQLFQDLSSKFTRDPESGTKDVTPSVWQACPHRFGSVQFHPGAFSIETLPSPSQLQMLPQQLSRLPFLLFGTKSNAVTSIVDDLDVNTSVPEYPKMQQHVVAPMPVSLLTEALLLTVKQRIAESRAPSDRSNYRAAFFIDQTVSVVELNQLFAFFSEGAVYFRYSRSQAEEHLVQVKLASIVNIIVFLGQTNAAALRDSALKLQMFSFRYRWFLLGSVSTLPTSPSSPASISTLAYLYQGEQSSLSSALQGLLYGNFDASQSIKSRNVTSFEFGRRSDIDRLGLRSSEEVLLYDLWSIWLPYLQSIACNQSRTINETVHGITGNFRLHPDGSANRMTWRLQIYSGVGNNSLQVSDWSSDQPFYQLPQPDPNRTIALALQELRNSKTPLRIATVLYPPYVLNGTAGLSGMYVDLCRLLLERLNITNYEFYLQEDGGFGQVVGEKWSDRKWNGLIGSVMEGRAQLGCAPVTITAARKKAVAFTHVIHSSKLSILYRRASANPMLQTFQFVTPLDWKIWLSVLGALLGVAMAIFVAHKLAPTPNVYFNVYNSVYFAFAEVVQGSSGDMPTRVSGRILVSFFWFFTLFLLLAYIANYAAFRTLDGAKQEVTSLATLLQSREFQFGMVRNTITASLLQSSSYIVMQQAYKLVVESFEHGLLDNTRAAITIMQNASLGYRFAFITDNMQNQYYSDINCDLVNTGEFYDLKNGLVVPRDSEMLPEFNRAIASLATEIKLLQIKYFSVSLQDKQCSDTSLGSVIQRYTPNEPWPIKSGALTPRDMLGIWIVNMIGCCLALGLSGIERLLGQLHDWISKRRRGQQNAQMEQNANELLAN